MCDGWNSKKRNHLVAFVLMVDGIPHPTRTFDNSGVKRDGALAFQQMLEEKTCLEDLYNVTVVGFCTDDGPDVVCGCRASSDIVELFLFKVLCSLLLLGQLATCAR